MDQEIRNKLRNVVTQCRKLLEDSVSQELEGKYGIFAKKDQVTADPNASMAHLTEEEQTARTDILDHFGHIKARGFKPKEALDQLVREIAFTHLNRLCAYKMMEAREVYVGGQKFREAVSRGINSNGVKFYLADHPEEERLFNTGQQDVAYRHFLDWLGGLLSDEIGVLFNPNDPANRLYPRQQTLDAVLALLNGGGIKPDETELREGWPEIWSQDETIGWVYQYFTPKELRDQARKESAAPRNSYELAFRNQFFTPRYVVEFLTDNTLGRIWYEMRKGDTKLKEQCRYMVRRPTEVFLKPGEQPPKEAAEGRDDLSQEELLKLPVHIPHRPKKDPRELKVLDPACGSGHFLLYCFDLLQTIYEEAYADPNLGPALKTEYPSVEDLRRDTPRLILACNLHGIDIDLRASQIAALALWLRCQRAYQEMGLRKDRREIKRSHFVCAEPMPGEEQMLKEFVNQLEPKLLGQVVEVVFNNMKLAGEAGSLLKIEEEIRDAMAAAKKQWVRENTQGTDRKGQSLLFTQAMMDRLAGKAEQESLFDLSDISDDQFFDGAEARVIAALRTYAEKAANGQRLQRRLFADDAVRGFAFVEVCHQRFDVVLMNPPFGEAVASTKPLLSRCYPSGKPDIYAAFVEMAASRLANGKVGVLSSRTGFFLPTLENWRKQYLLGPISLDVAADLGLGVLDEALVEAASYVLSSGCKLDAVFISELATSDKQAGLQLDIEDQRFQIRSTASLRDLPLSVVSYWVGPAVARLFNQYGCLEGTWGAPRVGLQTSDDFRFLRLFWEVESQSIGRDATWVPMAKGGEYQLFWDDIHLLVKWENDAEEMKAYARAHEEKTGWARGNSPLRTFEFYFKGGLTYPERTTSEFSPRVLPNGCITGTVGPGIHIDDVETQFYVLGWLTTRLVRQLIEVNIGLGDAVESGSAARHYNVRMVGRLPVPNLGTEIRQRIVETLSTITVSQAEALLCDETSRLFVAPFELPFPSIRGYAAVLQHESEARILQTLENHWIVERVFYKEMKISGSAEDDLATTVGIHPWSLDPAEPHCSENDLCDALQMPIERLVDLVGRTSGYARQTTKRSYFADRRIELLALWAGCHPKKVVEVRRNRGLLDPSIAGRLAKDTISWAMGCAVGRWDIRRAAIQYPVLNAYELCKCVPRLSDGMLEGRANSEPAITREGYPLRISWDGILTDDSEHEDDIINRARECLEAAWQQEAEAIEVEACDILCVKELRDYFRKPGKGGFWDDHIARYSKSRRKAPIYWLLQSSKKNYAVWLYYHRLDKDMLFKTLVNYVEPKIRLETSRLETFRSQKAAAGDSSKEGKRLAKEIEWQEDFLSELRDFEDKTAPGGEPAS